MKKKNKEEQDKTISFLGWAILTYIIGAFSGFGFFWFNILLGNNPVYSLIVSMVFVVLITLFIVKLSFHLKEKGAESSKNTKKRRKK